MTRIHKPDIQNARTIRQAAQLLDRLVPPAPPLDRAGVKIAAGILAAAVLALLAYEVQADMALKAALLSSAPDLGRALAECLAAHP